MISAKNILGIDIGGTHIRFAVIDRAFNVHHFTKQKSQQLLDTVDPIETLELLVRDFCSQNNVSVDAVSIGFPSTIDAKREVVVSTPNIKSLQNVAVCKDLSQRLSVPVYINRDVNYILLSDLADLDIDTNSLNVCGFYIGTGLGNTIMINGRLLIGKHGSAAELGHIHIPNFDMQCGCGSSGCIELLAGGLALARIQKEHFANTDISDIFIKHKDTKEIRTYIRDLAIAIANEIVIIDPDLSIIAGGVIQMAGFPKDLLEEYIYSYARRPCPKGSLSFVYTKDSQQSGVRGAGIYAFKRLEDPSYL